MIDLPANILRLVCGETGKAKLILRPISYQETVARAIKLFRLEKDEEDIALESADQTEILPETWEALQGVSYFRHIYIRIRQDTDSQDTAMETETIRNVSPQNDVGVFPNEALCADCNQVAGPQAISCSAWNCNNVWFHLSCAGLNQFPVGRWYCRLCHMQQPSPASPTPSGDDENFPSSPVAGPSDLTNSSRIPIQWVSESTPEYLTDAVEYHVQESSPIRARTSMSSHGRASSDSVRPIKRKREVELGDPQPPATVVHPLETFWVIKVLYGDIPCEIRVKPYQTVAKVLKSVCKRLKLERSHAKLILKDSAPNADPLSKFECDENQSMAELKVNNGFQFMLTLHGPSDSD